MKALARIAWKRFAVSAQYHLLPVSTGTQHTATAFTARVSLIYQPATNDSLHALVLRTFTPQGPNLALSLKSQADADLAAQPATNHEVGNKLLWLPANRGARSPCGQSYPRVKSGRSQLMSPPHVRY